MISTGGGEKPNDESFTHKFPMNAIKTLKIKESPSECEQHGAKIENWQSAQSTTYVQLQKSDFQSPVNQHYFFTMKRV